MFFCYMVISKSYVTGYQRVENIPRDMEAVWVKTRNI